MIWVIGVTIVGVCAGSYEAWALAKRGRTTITGWTKANPHLAIIVFTGLGLLFGYALGAGGA